MVVTLYSYQEEVVQWMLQARREGYKGGILAMLMGLGKTVCTFDYLSRTLEPNMVSLVAAPKSVIVAWQKIHSQFFADKLTLCHYTSRDDMLKHLFVQSPLPRVCLITLHCLGKLQPEDFRWMRSVVVDEAHAFANAKSKRTDRLDHLSGFMFELWLLSGTPIRNHYADILQLVRYLKTHSRWRTDWEMPRAIAHLGLPPIEDYRPLPRTRAKNQTLLDRLVLTCTYADTDRVLPPLHIHTHKFELTKRERVAYNFVTGMSESHMGRLTHQRMVVQMPGRYTRKMAKKLRDEGLADHITDLVPDDGTGGQISSKLMIAAQIVADNPGEPIVIFSTSKQVLEALRERLELSDERCTSFIHGGVGLQARQEQLTRWEANAGILLITLGTGGEGLTLTSAARCIHVDPWWCPATTDQATARLWRLGQTRPVHVHCLLASGTIESRQIWHCDRKNNLYKEMLGDGFRWSHGDDETIIQMARINEDLRDDIVSDVDLLPTTHVGELRKHHLVKEAEVEEIVDSDVSSEFEVEISL